jgi:benzoyl-CoA reductase/2-hydroxyglutaryl-CoA dehydratase subunit BcrC/BadD/HgdB
LHDELDKVLKKKLEAVNKLEVSRTTVRDSTSEMKQIHELMIKYKKRTTELDQLVTNNGEIITHVEDELEELGGRESLLKDTLGQLIKRREKVRVIYNGPLSNVAPAQADDKNNS